MYLQSKSPSKNANSLSLKLITQKRNYQSPAKPVMQCQCIMCTKPALQRMPLQRALSKTGVAADNDNTINTALGNIDGAGSTVAAGLYNAIATEVGMATESQAENGYTADAKGIAKVGTEIWVEGGTTFYNQIKGTYAGTNVKDKNGRYTRVHSEQHYEHRHGSKPSKVWCTVDNCYFCNKQLELDGIDHQAMKSSYIFPQFWTHPRGTWQIAKNSVGAHDGTGNVWTITHGTSSASYVNAKHTVSGESNV